MIVESGLDIPNVNTLIVNRADRLGLAQLYQLRGRVGRSNKRAYAYLFVPSWQALKKPAVRRLRAIEEFSDLGSGFHISMRDMEIRGAGNLLGAQQHGHIAAVEGHSRPAPRCLLRPPSARHGHSSQAVAVLSL